LSALFELVSDASATNAWEPDKCNSLGAAMAVIWPLLNSTSASPERETPPYSTPAEPNPAAESTSRVASAVAEPNKSMDPYLAPMKSTKWRASTVDAAESVLLVEPI
jgi:hypothetical protein